jgi:hypothetical protein
MTEDVVEVDITMVLNLEMVFVVLVVVVEIM